MKRVVLRSRQPYEFAVETTQRGGVRKGEMMVRIEYAAVTTHDVAEVNGKRTANLPFTPGLAATGIVVECGDQLHKWRFQGKRVGIMCSATWAEYVIVQSDSCFLLNDSITFEQGTSLFLTPLTVAMFEEHLPQSCRGVIQTGGATDVCTALMRLCNFKNIVCVSVVRDEEEAGIMLNLGAKYLILESDPKFREKIAVLAEETEATCAFDCVGGSVAGAILDALREGSTLFCHEVSYNMQEITGIRPSSLIFQKKKIVGLDVMSWFAQKSSVQKLSIMAHIQKFDFMYRTESIATFPISEVHSAIQHVSSRSGRGLALLRIDSIPPELTSVSRPESTVALELATLIDSRPTEGEESKS